MLRSGFWFGVISLCWPVAAMAQFAGVYTDRPGYAPGEEISIHASLPKDEKPTELMFRLIRLNDTTKEYGRSGKATALHQPTRIGSFFEVPGLSLSGKKVLTLEGWWYPTVFGEDRVVVAGQIALTQAAAGIMVSKDGRPAVYGSAAPAYDEQNAAFATDPLPLAQWVHLAAVFDGSSMTLFVDGKKVASKPLTQPLAKVDAAFRFGARSEAPGDRTGLSGGRFDAWAIWPKALTAAELQARIKAAKEGGADPAPTPDQVLLYVGFEQPKGAPQDLSSNKHQIKVVNHGTPHLTGVNPSSRAWQLHHDQVVDAGWPALWRIKVPDDAPSGFYMIQALVGPDFEGQKPSSSNVWGVVIRPKQPQAKVAVLVPVNTWVAYNSWPGQSYATSPTAGISLRAAASQEGRFNGGNNSAYNVRGDGVSFSFYQGWRRPNQHVQPFRQTKLDGVTYDFDKRAAMSRFMFEWLDREGFAYDTYTDWDLHRGRLFAKSGYKVLIVHGHAEYWSEAMLTQMAQALDAGLHVVALAGNMIGWRVTLDEQGVMEVRKWPTIPSLGKADNTQSHDQKRAGNWIGIHLCSKTGLPLALGSVTHMGKPCTKVPKCFGQWAVKDPSHWLLEGLGLGLGATFGKSPIGGVGSVGHETDITHPAFPPFGILPGTTPTILAEGRDFREPQDFQLSNAEALSKYSCEQLSTLATSVSQVRIKGGADSRSGQIYTYRHKGGGRVLVVGSTSAPWGLLGDPALSCMVKHALSCYAEGIDCDKKSSASCPKLSSCGGCQAGSTPSQWFLFGLLLLLFLRARFINRQHPMKG